jgi:hypothetical protein
MLHLESPRLLSSWTVTYPNTTLPLKPLYSAVQCRAVQCGAAQMAVYKAQTLADPGNKTQQQLRGASESTSQTGRNRHSVRGAQEALHAVSTVGAVQRQSLHAVQCSAVECTTVQ